MDDHPAEPRPASPPRFPLRAELALHHELHARPALPARSPCVVSAWAHWGMTAELAESTMRALSLSLGAALPAPGARHHLVQAPDWSLKIERHGEFVSFQVNRPLLLAGPVDEMPVDELRTLMLQSSAIDGLPEAFLRLLQVEGAGQMIAASHVVLLGADGGDDILPRCRALVAAQAGPASGDDAAPLMGAYVGDARRAALLTNLRLGPDGFVRFVLLDFGLPADQVGREAQRLCEIETYRMLAMLGFPVAQREAEALAQLERELQATVDAMAQDREHDAQRAFESLTRLAAEVEHSAVRTRYRFSATRAYERLVERRLSDLREQRIDGVQTLSGFLARRFAPAIAYCESTDRRLTDVADRIGRTAGLARVRVEMHREANNQELLAALAHRQGLQLRLQQTVEGLSVMAISYYALGLVGYLAKAAKNLPALEALHLVPDLVVGAAVLPVVGAVAWFMHRLHRHVAG